jgi:MFS family permease
MVDHLSGQLSSRKNLLMVAALLVSVMSFMLNASMLSPAIRDIETRLGDGSYAAMSAYFYLAGAVGNVVLIRWSDFIGRKRVLVAVLVVLCIGTVLCIFTTSLPLVLVGRMLQGISNVTYGLAFLIMREHLSAKAFGVAAGLITAMSGGVAGVDGLIGGYLSDRFGYQSIFVAILVVGVIAVVLCSAAVPADDPDRVAPGRMDWAGAALIAMGVAGINLFFSSGDVSGWGSPLALGFIIAATAALAALVVVEKRRTYPLVRMSDLRSREAWPVIAVTILNTGSFMMVTGFIVPYIAEDGDSGFGLSGFTTALLFLTPAAVVQLITAPLAGRLAVRIGFVTLLRIGQLGAVVVTVLLALFLHDKTVFAILVVLFGCVYGGLAGTAMSILGVVQAPEDEPGSLPGISNAAYGVGLSLGFAWAGPIVGSGTASSFPTALWVCVCVGVVGFVVSLVMRPRVSSQAPASSA